MIALPFIDPGVWPDLGDATVRLVRRAEPDPDPEQVEALETVVRDLIQDIDPNDVPYHFARELVKHNVRVGGQP